MIRCGVMLCPNEAPERQDARGRAIHVVRLPAVGGYNDDPGLAKFPRGTDLPVCDQHYAIFRRSTDRMAVRP